MIQHDHAIPVRYADTDAQGVVFFANYLTYMDEAATASLGAAGLPYQELLESGVDFVYADARVSYKSPARHGDTVTVRAHISRVGRTSFTTTCVLWVGERLIAEGALIHVCVGRDGRPVPVPDALRAAAAN